MPARCDFGIGDVIDSQYRVTKQLGEGSFGKVYRVSDSRGHDMALKLLKLWEVHPEIRQQLVGRFKMEYETGRIDSPYLVHSEAYGYVDDNPYIVMEFCPGGDLKKVPKGADWNRIGQEILLGLKALHSCGKVHRDLKPENVLMKADGTAVLTDFGISGDRNKRMTEHNILGKPQQIFGTYAYMPPEQVKPKNKDVTVLPTTDIFSYGVMMYELLTGELPFGMLNNECDLVEYLNNGKSGRWNRNTLNSTHEGRMFAPLIEGCLVPDLKHRIQSADQALTFLPKMGNMPKAYPSFDWKSPAGQVNGLMLRIMQGEEYGKTYDLTQMASRCRVLKMGRRSSSVMNNIPIMEEQSCYVSRMHCTLEYDATGKSWYIRDGQWDMNTAGGWKKSMNGTYVNSTEVSEQGLRLTPGDIITIGDTKLRVETY